MFYGYDSEAEMRKYNPVVADHLVSVAETRKVTFCSRGKMCIGSPDGETCHYAEGSKDQGTTAVECRAVMGCNEFRWTQYEETE